MLKDHQDLDKIINELPEDPVADQIDGDLELN